MQITITSHDYALTDKEANELSVQLIKTYIKKGLKFHVKNFKANKINWKKGKIRKNYHIL